MTARKYSSIAPQMLLQGSVTSANTTLTVDTVAGLPGAFPYTVVIDPGLGPEEICTVTSAGGLVLTVTRGQDGSTATSHSVGAIIRHMATARDYQEPQDHIAASAAVHGLAGTVVGTTDAQTLTNKTVSGSANTLTNIPNSALSTGIDAGKVASVASSFVAKSALPTDAVYLATAQTLTNKTLTSPVVNTPTGIVKGDVGLGNVDNTSDVTKNAAAVTLTNKTISGAANTLTNLPGANIVGANAVPKSVLPSDTLYSTVANSLVTSTSAYTAAANWTLSASSRVETRSGVIMGILIVTRTTSTLAAGANGNFVDSLLATSVAAPAQTMSAAAMYGTGTASNIGAIARVQSDGQIVLIAGGPNADVAVGDQVTVTFALI